MQSSKQYQVHYQYIDDTTNAIQKEWIVTLSHRTLRAMKQYKEALQNMKKHPYQYLLLGYNRLELVKSEEIYLLCTYTVRNTILSSYCTEQYLDKLENRENEENNNGYTTSTVSNSSTVTVKRNGSSLVKIPSPDSRAPRRVNFSSEQIAKGEEYFDIIYNNYHNVEF